MNEVSDILKVYLGAGDRGGYLPYGHEERMRVAYADDARIRLAQVQKYLDEDQPMSSRTSLDMVLEQKIFEAALASKFPELDAVAINSLACRWSYAWR